MNYYDWIGKHTRTVRELVLAFRLKLIYPVYRTSNNPDIKGRHAGLFFKPDPRVKWLEDVIREKQANHLYLGRTDTLIERPEGWVLVGAFVDLIPLMMNGLNGVKSFRPTSEECEVLEEIELSFPVSDYKQPFPSFVIEFPPEYQEMRKIDTSTIPIVEFVEKEDHVTGTMRSQDRYSCENSLLIAVQIVHHPEEGILTTTTVFGDDAGTTITVEFPDNKDGQTLEKLISVYEIRGDLADDVQKAANILSCAIRYIRVAINSCMMLMANGFRKIPEDSLYRQKAKYLQKSVDRDDEDLKQLNCLVEVHKVPLVYDFEQRLDLRRIVGSKEAFESTPTGKKIRPHWRRSHWRSQRYGQGNQYIKRIVIPHCMVSSQFFLGKEGDTKYKA